MTIVELSIDFGSNYITIYQKGIGLVLREPSIAIVRRVKDKFEIKDAGYRAESIVSSSFGNARMASPIKEGLVVDEEMAANMLKHFLKKILPNTFFAPHIRAIISISCAMTNSDRKAVEKCCIKAGIKDITLVESPLSLLAYTKSIGGLFVDIGGGKTEICGVTNLGISNGCAVNIAGSAFNGAIVDRLHEIYGVKLGENTVENMKKSSLSFYVNDESSYAVTGAGVDGSLKSLCVPTSLMRDAVIPLVDDIIEVIISVLNSAPPELSAEILRKGIFLTGGSSNIPGLVQYLEQALEISVNLLEDIEYAVAIGGGVFLDDKELLSTLLGLKIN